MLDTSKLTFAVVGATGAVGREMVAILSQRGLRPGNLKLLASERSLGETLEMGDDELDVEVLNEDSFRGVDVALFSAGSSISATYAPIAVEAGTVVIDNSSCFRMESAVPLIVPEVNPEVLEERLNEILLCGDGGAGLVVANPNCSTIQLVVVLKPILDTYGLERIVVSTYQSVSGAGQKGIDELWEQSRSVFSQEGLGSETFPHEIAFNCLPQIDSFLPNGYTKEEMKLINESRKILGVESLAMTATAVRIPVFFSHSESVNIQTSDPASSEELRELLERSPGIVVVDDPENLQYPLARDVAGEDEVYVGRIREDCSIENGLDIWIVADNLRKGAALNAVQIAEMVAARLT